MTMGRRTMNGRRNAMPLVVVADPPKSRLGAVRGAFSPPGQEEP